MADPEKPEPLISYPYECFLYKTDKETGATLTKKVSAFDDANKGGLSKDNWLDHTEEFRQEANKKAQKAVAAAKKAGWKDTPPSATHPE